MAEIPTIEPQSIIKGDTLKFTKSLPDYPAGTWILTYTFLGPTKQTVTAAQSGTDHAVSASTTSWTAGDYAYQGKVTNGSETYTVAEGTITVKPSMADLTAGADTRSHVKTVLDSIEAAIEKRATRTDLEVTIAGRTIRHMTPEELIRWHSHYKKLYQQELQAERVNQGLGTGRKILTRFRA